MFEDTFVVEFESTKYVITQIESQDLVLWRLLNSWFVLVFKLQPYNLANPNSWNCGVWSFVEFYIYET